MAIGMPFFDGDRGFGIDGEGGFVRDGVTNDPGMFLSFGAWAIAT